jgi:hypothetical protein
MVYNSIHFTNDLHRIVMHLKAHLAYLTTLVGFSPIQVSGDCPEPLGTFYAPPETVLTQQHASGHEPFISVADLNNDNLDDILVTLVENLDFANEGFRLFILINNGNGGFVESSGTLMNDPVPTDYGETRQQFLKDFNGDNQNDILVSSHGLELGPPDQWPLERNLLYLSNPDGTFRDASAQIASFIGFSHGTTIGDLEGDMDFDIFDGYVNGPLLLNDGSGGLQDVTNRLDLLAHKDTGKIHGNWFQFMDATGDGRDELLVLDDDGWDVPRMAINDGTGHFSKVVRNPIENKPAYAGHQNSAAADLNHDGLEDVVVHECAEYFFPPCYLRVLMSNGNGTFWNPPGLGFPDHPAVDSETHIWDKGSLLDDVNGDDEPDIVQRLNGPPPGGSKTLVFINDGSGLFRVLPFGFTGECSMPEYVIDVDGDGGADLVTTCVTDDDGNVIDGIGIKRSIVPYGPDITGNMECNRIVGGIRDNTFEGRAGDDELLGGDGADTLRGEEGDDTLSGEGGDDLLDGGPGNDSLIGGEGHDSYIYHLSDTQGVDLISDMKGTDTLKFVDFDLDQVTSVSQSENGALLLVFTSGLNLTIEQHFSGNNYGIERLEAAGCTYRISKDSGFESGTIQDLTGVCIIFDDGFEDPPRAAPAAPTVSVSIPTSPADDNNPRIIGNAQDGTIVKLYSDSACSNLLGSGTAEDFNSVGITINVSDDSATTVYATATVGIGAVSSCSSSGIVYVELGCDIGSGAWAAEARDCTTEDCSDGRWHSWDGKTWCRALITKEGGLWNVAVPQGASTFDFWADWGAWDLNDCGDGVTSISISVCGLNETISRNGIEQHLTCDVTGQSSFVIEKEQLACEYVIIGKPYFY